MVRARSVAYYPSGLPQPTWVEGPWQIPERWASPFEMMDPWKDVFARQTESHLAKALEVFRRVAKRSKRSFSAALT